MAGMAVPQKTRKRVSVVEYNNKREFYEEENTKYKEVYEHNIPKGYRLGYRHLQGLLLCMGLIGGIATRTNLSVAIVAMTDSTTSSNPNIPTYTWNNKSVMLSAFFWSYISFQVLAGYLGKRYGPKYFLLVAFSINCCACASTPMAAALMGSSGVILCRIVQGLCQGFLYPSVQVMLASWVPVQERTTMNNFVFSGVALGTIFSSILTGYVSASWWGWPASFYILAVLGGAWCILWVCFGYNTPNTHPSISAEEKKYIQSSMKQDDDVHLPVPWKKIFTCVPFYAIMAASVGNTWGYAVLMTETPTYLAKVMNFDVKSNALINALPTCVGLITGLIIGPLSDWLINNKYLSTLNARRMFQVIGCYGQALCIVWLSFLTKSQAHMSIIVLSLGNLLTSCGLAGSSVNHLDLSPRFCGVIFGILNASGQAASIAAPLVMQWIVTDLTNIMQWRIMFLISAGFYIAGATVFFFFASATRQPWDGPENKELEERTKKISVISFTGV